MPDTNKGEPDTGGSRDIDWYPEAGGGGGGGGSSGSGGG